MHRVFRLTVFLLFTFYLISCQNPQTLSQEETHYNDFKFQEYTIAQLQEGYQKGDFSIREVVQSYLDRIEAIDKKGPALNSVIQLNPDALKIADQLDQELKNGKARGPMHGVPVLLKDNIDTHDQMETTAGSRALKGSKPSKDSFIAQKLREAGAVIIGKTNLSEWANFRGELSTSGWSGVGGQTKNPYILDRNPCGSSSGSGVAPSANLCIVAIGTETNGSIVCPSNNNGIVGIKPTVGLLSRSGIIPISFTQDTPGPMARTVRDAAICLGAMVGIDSSDSKTLASEGKFYKDYTQFLKKDGLKGKRIGLFKAPFGRNFKVDQVMNKAVEYLKSQGVQIIEIEEISTPNVGGLSYTVLLYEFKDGINQYLKSLGAKAPFKTLEEIIAFNEKDSIELKYFDQDIMKQAQAKGDLNSQEYQEALAKMLKTIREEGIDEIMQENKLDALIAPTGGPAWKTDLINGDSFQLGSSSPAAQAGYPNITVPMGFVEGLPVGISFFGRAWSEPLLLEIAYSYEQGTKHRKVPEFQEK
ncbi:MAG: amidase [Microscillaceae bacterium]|nr:amidase [Microscillaceae bacterium]